MCENNKTAADQSSKNKSQIELEKILFELESSMNSNKYNRKKVCTDSASEKGRFFFFFLQQLTGKR